jgi:hypothetical protein
MLVFLVGFFIWLLAGSAALGLGYECYQRQKHVRAFLCASVAWAIFSAPYTWAAIDGGAPAFMGLLVNIPLAASLLLTCIAIFRPKTFQAS